MENTRRIEGTGEATVLAPTLRPQDLPSVISEGRMAEPQTRAAPLGRPDWWEPGDGPLDGRDGLWDGMMR